MLVPVQCEFFALEGISQLKETIDQIRATLNPGLEIQGVVLTMHDARTSLSREVADEVRAFFGPKVYETIIPRNTRVAEAPSHGKPILLYDYDCAGSQAYIQLATEIIERERRNQGRLDVRRSATQGQEDPCMNAPLPKSRLGRGLASLIGETPVQGPRRSRRRASSAWSPIDAGAPEPLNPRKDFRDDELAELAESIRTKGLVQPIIVRPTPRRRLRDRRRRAALARGAEGRPAHRAGHRRASSPTRRCSSSPSSRTCSAPTSTPSRRRPATAS